MDLDKIERHVGTQIKMLRIAQKMSQKDLAQKMGITYQQVQKFESGLNRIAIGRLWQICKIFEISPNYLFDDILANSPKSDKIEDMIPSNLATSQDIKLILAFKKIKDGDTRNLAIKLCEALAKS